MERAISRGVVPLGTSFFASVRKRDLDVAWGIEILKTWPLGRIANLSVYIAGVAHVKTVGGSLYPI